MSGSAISPADRFAQAQALERRGAAGEAEAVYRELLAAYPGQPLLLARLALVLKGRGALSEAETLLRRAIAGAPGEAALHNNLGNVLRNLNRLADAEEAYRKAIAIDPSYAEARYNFGAVLEDLGRPDEALAMYRQAVEAQDRHAGARTRIGVLLRGRGELDAALAELDIATAAAPQSFEAHYYKGLVLGGLERYDEAAAALAHAATLRSESVDVLLGLANALKAAERIEEALDAYWRAIEVQPLMAAVHDDLNRLAWMADRKDLFLKSYAFARERHGEDPGLMSSEAQIRMQRNDPNGAEPLLRRVLEIDPRRADANALLGRLLARRERFAESFEAFATAIKSDPTARAYRNEFGYALLQGQEPQQALKQFDAARQMSPVDQLALAGACVAYRVLGDSRYHTLVNLDAFVRVYPLPLPPGYRDVASYNAALGEELSKLHTLTAEPLEQTLRGGSQTTGLLFARKSKMIEQVRDQISEAVADYVRVMPEGADHPLLSRKEGAFSFTHSWSCKLRSSGFHTNHVHPMGWISSAYYVSLPGALDDDDKRQGWLKFGESHLELGGDDQPERHVKPVVGHLVLFPSYFWHGTVPFESKDDRLTVAFDVVPGRIDPSTIATSPY